ncbi:MAG: hypothetical protein ACOZBL_02805 [Patescibacteria group bacterium]
MVRSYTQSQSKSILIILFVLKSDLGERIFDIIVKVTSSQTFALIGLVLNVTIGISGLAAFGGKNNTGHFQIISSLLISQPSLSIIFTPNVNSQGTFGTAKNV